MGTSNLFSLGVVAGGIVAIGVFRWAFATLRAKPTPAPVDDLKAIEAALAADGGRIVRASLERPGNLIGPNAYLDERSGARLYHVTLEIGSTKVRRRVAVRDGAPAVRLS
ncbi:MAG TPA: hypothetical protein VGM25_10350 [Caulobacteraceae bacterium]|jgi:hypothetical protein